MRVSRLRQCVRSANELENCALNYIASPDAELRKHGAELNNVTACTIFPVAFLTGIRYTNSIPA